MPFSCKYCSKAFTQAGNRDRHQNKMVCMKKNYIPGETFSSKTNTIGHINSGISEGSTSKNIGVEHA